MSGRNNAGEITVRHRGGRCKKAFRIIDYKRTANESLLVLRLEHDSIGMLILLWLRQNKDVLKYIIAVDGLKVNNWIKNNYERINNIN